VADKTVTVKLNADTHGFTAAMARAATASKQLGSQVKAHGTDFDRMASASTKAGLAVTAGVGGAVKAAVDWESAWTGVQKTVDATPAQYARLEGQLRSLTSVLPVSHQEIAGVAEAAGQLGVKQQDVAKFTSTMVKLGTATNMTSEEAATSLRQFMNVMGTAPKDVDRLAATVVDLGNNSATTERDIVEMGQRLSGTGKQMRMSEPQVMAFGAAMASVGINAEAGGTAMSRNWIKIDKAVRSGGQSLQTMAQVSGMSAAQFKKAWQTDAAGATNALIEGLGRASKSGQDVSKLLDQMGIKGQYQTDAMKRLAGASAGAGNAQDQLADSLKIAGQGWSQNTALEEEFGRRQQTTASQMQLAMNRIKDAAINVGQAALPVLGRAAQKVSGYADRFAKLSPRTQEMILKIGALGGVSLIAAGQVGKVARAFKDVGLAVKAIRGITGIAGAFAGIGGPASKAAGGVTAAGKAMSGVGGATAGLSGKLFGVAAGLGAVAVAWAHQHDADWAASIDRQLGSTTEWAEQAKLGVVDLDDKLKQVNDGGFGPLRENLTGLGDALNHATGTNLSFWQRQESRLAGVLHNSAELSAQSKSQMAKLDSALSGLATSHSWTDLKNNWKQIADAARENGISDDKIMSLFPKVQAGLAATAKQLGVTGLSAKDYAGWLRGEVPSAVNRAAVANEKLAKSLGIVPDRKRVQLETVIKGGKKGEVEKLNKEILKLPKDKRTRVLATAKTKGFREAMAQAKDLEKQAKGLQETTRHGVKLDAKGSITSAQVHAMRQQLDGLSKAAAKEVALKFNTGDLDGAKRKLQEFQNTVRTTTTTAGVKLEIKGATTGDLEHLRAEMDKLPKEKQVQIATTAKTDGFDKAMGQADEFLATVSGIRQQTAEGITVHAKGVVDAKQINALRVDMEQLSKEDQQKVSITAETKGLEPARRQIDELRTAHQRMDSRNSKPIVMKATVDGGAKRDLTILDQQVTNMHGKKVLIPASAPGAAGTLVDIDGIQYKVEQLDGKNALVQLGLKNTDGTYSGLKEVDAKRQELDGKSATVKLNLPNTGDTEGKLNKVGKAADRLNGKKATVHTSAPSAGRTTSLLGRIMSAAGRVSAKRAMVRTSAPGAAQAHGLLNRVRSMASQVAGKHPRVVTSAPGAVQATGLVRAVGRMADWVNGKHARVTASANTGSARSALNALTRPLRTTVTAVVHTVGNVANAVKGIFHANGGLYERHDAQIAKAGAYRIWAEPETEGEAYIPFARSKRGRSRMIAAQAVQRLGGAVQWFANGGINGAQARMILNIEARPTGELADYVQAVRDAANATRDRQRASRAWWNARRRHSKSEKKLGEALAKSKEKEKEAADKARQAQDALARAAQQAGDTMAKDYRAGGSWQDWAASMREGVKELDLFRWRLAKLRGMGLSQDNIDTIAGMGPGGLQLAGDVLAGGKTAVNSLNKASNQLKRVSDQLGLVTMTKYADGGFSSGRGVRVWSEPETGGEAYIPLSGSKRSRSVQLWWETGRRLGAVPATGQPRPATPPPGTRGGYTPGPLDLSGLHITLSVPGLANAVDAKIVAANRATARNLVRSR
jgi:phage tail tape measure protein, TP901 family